MKENPLTLDRTDWRVLGNVDGTCRVLSEGTGKVIAPSLSLSLATQIVDEHLIAVRVYALVAHYPNIIDVDGREYARALRVA